MKDGPILLVEDDPNDTFFFERAMKQAHVHHPLRVVRDGLEAIAYFAGTGSFADRGHNPLPSLVVLDLNLPHKHGLEVLQWIRNSAPDPLVPVVVLTSSVSDLDTREAYRSGANSYLVKPSQPTELTEMVRLLDLYWIRHNRVAPSPNSMG